MNQYWRLPSTKLRVFLIIVLILGIFFRFVNLDQKIYWQDEVATSLRISGSPLYQVYQQEFNGAVITVKELHKYVGYSSDKNIIDVIKALVGNPEHAPLYYLIARFWMQLFGYSALVMRSLPALISLFSLPSIYWLCIELFESPLVGWVAVTLVSVSPFHVLYAQEARQYSVWIVTIFLSSAALLRAIRLNTKISWGIYTATLIAALYTHIFSGLVAIGHAIYIVITNQFRFDKKLANYCIALIAGLLAFVPWVIILLYQRIAVRSNTAWTQENVGLIVPLKR